MRRNPLVWPIAGAIGLSFSACEFPMPEIPDLGGEDAAVPNLGVDAGVPNGGGGGSMDPDTGDPQPDEFVFEPFVPSSNNTVDELATFATWEGWRERVGEQGDLDTADTERCVNYLDDLEIIAPDSATFYQLCHFCDASDSRPECDSQIGRVHACAAWSTFDGSSSPFQHPIIVLDSGHGAEREVRSRLIIHEMNHHLGVCAREGGDAPHAAGSRWCGPDLSECSEQDHTTSVAARAQAIFADWLETTGVEQ